METLRLESPRMRGSAVRRWQEILRALGFDLGPWGVDGIYGPAVATATSAFQISRGLPDDGSVDDVDWNAAETAFNAATSSRPTVAGVRPALVNGVEVWDYRGVAKPPSNYSRDRAWSEVTGIVLHRTACVLGENPARYLPVNAHVGVTMGGRVVLAHGFHRMIWHGHSPSPWTIGIEFDGNPEGRPGYHWRPGGGPHPITAEQERAAAVLLELLVGEFARNGQAIRFVVAHRQSSSDRECDPGFECWQKVAVPWMATTGAIPGPRPGHPVTKGLIEPVGFAGDTWGSGFQIPTEWDGRSPIPFWGGR